MKQANQFIDPVKNLFGQHPLDVISPINSASESLLQLAELFKTISKEALIERNGYRIKRLAEAGAHIADDMSNYTDCVHESLVNNLRKSGITLEGEGA